MNNHKHPDKLSRAITRIILENPFYSSLLLKQNIVVGSVKTFAVDGVSLFYNPDFLNKLSDDEVVFVLAHEMEHLARRHHLRKKNREHTNWNKACDYAINPLLISSNVGKMPHGGLIGPFKVGECAENIYKILEQHGNGGNGGNKNKKQQNNGGNNSSQSGNPTNSSGSNQNNNQDNDDGSEFGEVLPYPGDETKGEEEMGIAIQQALNAAKQRGKLPSHLKRLFEEVPPNNDWREILARFLSERSFNDYTFSRPNRRFVHQNIILPTRFSREYGRVCLAVDTSGSIGQKELNQFITELKEILNVYEANGQSPELMVIWCDAMVHGHQMIDNSNTETIMPRGGGGTDFDPVFKYIEGLDEPPICLIYYTDGYGPVTVPTPDYPVIWTLIMHNPSFNPHFGETLYVGDITV